MLHRPTTEIWHPGIVHQPVSELLTPGALAKARITWLPIQPHFTFLADPFGIWKDGVLTVFVEHMAYRTKHGEIRYCQYNQDMVLVKEGLALRTQTHISYPQIIENGGEVYMLPEAYRSGKLTLYRAKQFPDQWEPVADLLNVPAIDASVVKFQNRWWMFYALPGKEQRALREVHVAYADSLTGPWHPHANNPVRVALDSARPSGTPFVHEDALYLPTQNSTTTYGEAINVLKITALSPTSFEASIAANLTPGGIFPGYSDGLHTLSACGGVTLIDVKKIDRSHTRRLVNLERRLRRALRLFTS